MDTAIKSRFMNLKWDDKLIMAVALLTPIVWFSWIPQFLFERMLPVKYRDEFLEILDSEYRQAYPYGMSSLRSEFWYWPQFVGELAGLVSLRFQVLVGQLRSKLGEANG